MSPSGTLNSSLFSGQLLEFTITGNISKCSLYLNLRLASLSIARKYDVKTKPSWFRSVLCYTYIVLVSNRGMP